MLSGSQPHGVLASRGEAREVRREFNEAALHTEQRMHGLAPSIVDTVGSEAESLLRQVDHTGRLNWLDFADFWWRMTRRIVLGSAAREDHQLTDDLARLRGRANWALLLPTDKHVLRRFHDRLRRYLDNAEPGSLAEVIAATWAPSGVAPTDQVAHWLFAFDSAAMSAFRTLALLATHPKQVAAVRDELDGADLSRPRLLEQLRASVLDTVRLWPTTPMIVRESATPITWGGQEFGKGTMFAMFTPFFHRDPGTVDVADRFAPEIWLDGRDQDYPALVPFSSGPAVCPAQNLVLLVASTTLARLLKTHDFALTSHPPLEPKVPATIDHFRLRFSAGLRD